MPKVGSYMGVWGGGTYLRKKKTPFFYKYDLSS